MKPAPALLQSLARSKLLPRHAAPGTGFGQRRSRTRGAGMEFIDHRAYQSGDDLRRIDPHLRARLGENFVREYEVQRQLPVTILLDKSASMAVDPDRAQYAASVAALLGFAALSGGDVLRFGLCAGDAVNFSPRLEGLARADHAFAFSDDAATGGHFRDSLAAIPADRQWQGLFILISDFWDDTAPQLSRLAAAGTELWCLHLETPQERDPTLLGAGELRMIDAETGEELDLVLDSDTLAQYHAARDAHRADLETTLAAVGGSYLPISTSTPLASLVQSWRSLGFLS